MTLILDVGRNTNLMMALNLCLMPLEKIIEINYTYGSPKQSTKKNILWRVTVLFISQRMGDRDELFTAKGRLPEGKNTLQRK